MAKRRLRDAAVVFLMAAGTAGLVQAGAAGPANAGVGPGDVRAQTSYNGVCEVNELCLYRLRDFAGGVNDTVQYNSSYFDTTGAADRFSTGYSLNDRVTSVRNRDSRYWATVGQHTRPNIMSGGHWYLRPGFVHVDLEVAEAAGYGNINDSFSSHCWFDSVNSCAAWGVPRP